MSQAPSTKLSKAAKRRAEIARIGEQAYYEGKKQRREIQQQQEQVKADAAKSFNGAYESATREQIIKAHGKGVDRFGKYNILPNRLRSSKTEGTESKVSEESSESAVPPRVSKAVKRRAVWADIGKEAYYQQKQERKERQQEMNRRKDQNREGRET